MHRPAFGEGHRELHAGVIEAVVAHDALFAGRTEGQTVDRLEIVVAVIDPAAARHGGDVRGAERCLHDALIGRGVIGEHAVVDVGVAALFLGARELEGLLRLEDLHRIAHRLRAITAARGVLEPQAIGLRLLVAAVALHPGRGAEVRHFRQRRIAGQDGGGQRARPQEHAARLAARRMARDVVTDLVAEHGGELGFGIQVRQQPAMDVDVTAADGEGVQRVVIEHEELEIPVRNRRIARDARADHLHIVLQRLVLVQAVELLDLLVGAPRPFLLAFHRGEDDVVRAAFRIGGAAARGERDGAGGGGGECAAHDVSPLWAQANPDTYQAVRKRSVPARPPKAFA